MQACTVSVMLHSGLYLRWFALWNVGYRVCSCGIEEETSQLVNIAFIIHPQWMAEGCMYPLKWRILCMSARTVNC